MIIFYKFQIILETAVREKKWLPYVYVVMEISGQI